VIVGHDIVNLFDLAYSPSAQRRQCVALAKTIVRRLR